MTDYVLYTALITLDLRFVTILLLLTLS